MRKSLRRDWAVLTYRYWMQPIEIPQELWDTARKMLSLWNQLVDYTRTACEEIQSREINVSESGRAAAYSELRAVQRRLVQDSGLEWNSREFIFDRFIMTFERWLKNSGRAGCFDEAGFPKRRKRLDRIAIRHRYSNAGIPVSRLIRPHSRKSAWRFWLRPVPPESHLYPGRASKRLCLTEGFFGIQGVKVSFKAIIHRRVPDEAIVKNVLLIGRYSRQFSWDWAIALVCQIPPRPVSTHLTGRFCGLDLGWRKFDSYLRIGMLVDNAGNVIELRLPLDMSNRSSRDFNNWIDSIGRPETRRIYQAWAEVEEAITAADQSMEAVKAQLTRTAEGIEWSNCVQSWLSRLPEVRQGGLVLLLRALKEAQAGEDLQDLITAWKSGEDRAQRRILSARSRFVRRRHWLYQNLAAWIARNHDVIAWEEDLDLKGMSEVRGRAKPLERADRYRQIAAIGELRSILRRQVKKHHSMLIDGVTAYSTIRCFTCGAHTQAGADLELQCPAGHVFDQDENAARWFLSEVNNEIASRCIRIRAWTPSELELEVPTILSSIILPRVPLRPAPVHGAAEGSAPKQTLDSGE